MTKTEQVARAIAACQAELGPEKWRYCVTEARAAIEAMREPTPVMLEAGCREAKECDPSGQDWVPEEAAHVFNAMIDAALAEGE